MPKRKVDKTFDDRMLDIEGNLTEAGLRRAKLAVCEASTDIDDARILLSMLGLVDDEVRFPTPRTDAHGHRMTRRSSPLGAPLPPSGYGAVSSHG